MTVIQIKKKGCNVMYERINQMQFIHKIELAKITKTVLKVADDNNVTEADICILAGMLHIMHDKSNADIAKLLTETLLFNKVEIKRMKASDSFEVERIKYLAKNFFITFSTSRISQAFSIPVGNIELDTTLYYNKFMLLFLSDNYSGTDDETIIEEFIEAGESGSFLSCARIFLLSLILGRFKLLEKLSIIQNKKFNKSFMYALNQEIIRCINLLIRYGRGNKIDIVSDEFIEMCNAAIDEVTNKLSDVQYEYVLKIEELNKQLMQSNAQIVELTEQCRKLQESLDYYQRNKILKDKKVLVISDENHRDGYKEIVERHGGIFEFVSGVDTNINYVMNRARSSDEVFFCTAYTKHKLFYAGIKDLENLHYVQNIGLDSLEREINKLNERR